MGAGWSAWASMADMVIRTIGRLAEVWRSSSDTARLRRSSWRDVWNVAKAPRMLTRDATGSADKRR